MYDPAGSGEPYVGVRLLYPNQFANLSAISNAQYVTPGNMMSETVKDSLLRGRIHVRNSTSTTNWSEVVSAGPFDIPVNWYQRVVFAFVGGTDDASIKANSDSAQSWWNRNSGIEERGVTDYASGISRDALSVEPSLTHGRVVVRYSVSRPGPVTIAAYDITGKQVARLLSGNAAGRSSLVWQPGALARGVYFVKLESGSGCATAKLVLDR